MNRKEKNAEKKSSASLRAYTTRKQYVAAWAMQHQKKLTTEQHEACQSIKIGWLKKTTVLNEHIQIIKEYINEEAIRDAIEKEIQLGIVMAAFADEIGSRKK